MDEQRWQQIEAYERSVIRRNGAAATYDKATEVLTQQGGTDERRLVTVHLCECAAQNRAATNAAIDTWNVYHPAQPCPLITDSDMDGYYGYLDQRSDQEAELEYERRLEDRGWQEAELEARRGFGH